MLDRFVNASLWLAIMILITASAGSSLLIAYRGLLDLCASRYAGGTTHLSAGFLLAVGSYLLGRNANDLMDR